MDPLPGTLISFVPSFPAAPALQVSPTPMNIFVYSY